MRTVVRDADGTAPSTHADRRPCGWITVCAPPCGLRSAPWNLLTPPSAG